MAITPKMYAFNLDLYDSTPIPRMEVVCQDKDTNKMQITLTSNSVPIDLTNKVLQISYTKANGQLVINRSDESVQYIRVIDIVNGKLEVILTTQAIAVEGLLKCAISIIEGTSKLTFPSFKIIVNRNYDNDKAVQSTNEISILNNVISEWNEIKNSGGGSNVTNLSQLTDDTTHRLVTDTEKTTWNNKQNALSGDTSEHYHSSDRNWDNIVNKPTIPTDTNQLLKTDVYTKLETYNKTEIDGQLNDIIQQTNPSNNSFPIKGVALGDTYNDGTSTQLADRIAYVATKGCTDFQFVPVIAVDHLGATFTRYVSDAYIKSITDLAKSVGMKASILKPHMNVRENGVGLPDYHRDPDITGHESDYFAKVKTELLHYAQVASDNGYEYFCLLSESYEIENQQYSSYWQDIVQSIRLQNPALKIAVSDVSTNSCLYPLVDAIGIHYGGLNTSVYYGNYDIYPLEDNFTLKKGLSIRLNDIHNLYIKYGKPIFFGEYGNKGMTLGLAKNYPSNVLYSEDYASWKPEIQQIYYECFLSVFTQTDPKEFLGGYIWSISDWDQNTEHWSPFHRLAESVVEKYFKGVE